VDSGYLHYWYFVVSEVDGREEKMEKMEKPQFLSVKDAYAATEKAGRERQAEQWVFFMDKVARAIQVAICEGKYSTDVYEDSIYPEAVIDELKKVLPGYSIQYTRSNRIAIGWGIAEQEAYERRYNGYL
jgi:hypothetical protein